MKISGAYSPISAGVSSGQAPEAPSPAANAAAVDKVTTADVGAAVSNGIALATTERAIRLHALAQAVKTGVYQPNASQLAGKLLEQAELDARINNYFS